MCTGKSLKLLCQCINVYLIIVQQVLRAGFQAGLRFQSTGPQASARAATAALKESLGGFSFGLYYHSLLTVFSEKPRHC